MNDNSFDQELLTLFERRKAALDMPIIRLETVTKGPRKQPVWLKVMSVFSLAFGMSFGVFALISYLASPIEVPPATISYSSPIAVTAPIAEDNDTLNIYAATLPPTKPTVRPTRSHVPVVDRALPDLTLPKIENTPRLPQVIVMEDNSAKPALAAPRTMILPKLTHKVMPKYPANAVKRQIEGVIKLSYYVDQQGKVTNIELLSTKESPLLVRTAKSALLKWMYEPSVVNVDAPLTVTFEFTLANQKSR